MRTVIGSGLIVLVFAVGCWRQAGPVTPAPAKKVYDRDEFKKAVVGKTADEVKAMLGAPDKTSETGGSKGWIYYGVSRDAATGKTDYATQLWFEDGRRVSGVTS